MGNTNTTKTAKAADFSVLFGAQYQRRVATGETGKECACCGKQTAQEWFVNTDGDDGLNQGCFPVGPECFKRLKKAGIAVLTAAEMGA